MKIVDTGQGFSEYTVDKQNTFRYIIRSLLSSWKFGILPKCRWARGYFYIDTTSGEGRDKNGELGSPLIFLDEAKKINVDFSALFIDKVNIRWKKLLLNCQQFYPLLERKRNIVFRCFDYSKYLEISLQKLIPEFNKSGKYGLCYVDSNGIPNLDCFHQIMLWGGFNQIDLLVNLNANSIKRVRCCSKIPEKRTLEQRLQPLIPNKRYWLIKVPENHTGWQWSFLIGTNWDSFPELKNIGFYSLDSSKGKEILYELNYTKKEKEEAYENR